MTGSVDPELEALAERIAVTRAAIAELEAERARVEATEAPLEGADADLAAMRERICAARVRLAEVEAMPTGKPRPNSAVSLEAALRNSLYFAGMAIALPGLITLGFLVRESRAHPEEKLDPVLILISALPLLLGLGLIARARFAKYRASKSDLDGDFLG